MDQSIFDLTIEDFLQSSDDAVILLNAKQEIVLFNSSAERIFGYRVQEIFGKHLNILLPPRLRRVYQTKIQAFAASSEEKCLIYNRSDVFGLRKNGEIFVVEGSIAKIQKKNTLFFIVFLRDISQRKFIEQSMMQWALAFENAEWGIVIGQAKATDLEIMNPAFPRLYGYSVEELTGMPIADIYAPEDREKIQDWIRQAHEQGHITYEARHLRKDGSSFQALVDIKAIKDDLGEVLFRVVNVQDITERRLAEAALRERDQQYYGIFKSTQDGLFINRFDGALVDFNPAAAVMHGYTVDEFRELQPEHFIHPDSFHVFKEYLETVKAGKQFRGRAIDVRKDGSQIHVEVVGTVFMYQGEPHTLAVVRDITELVRAYQLLERRAEAHARELSALLVVSRNISSNLDLGPLLKLILVQLKTVVNFTGAAVSVIEGDDIVILEYYGPTDRKEMVNRQFPVTTSGGYLEVINQRAPFIIHDIWGNDPWLKQVQENAQEAMNAVVKYAHAWLGLPLVAKNELIGVLRLDHHEAGYYTSEHAQLATAFAELAAIAIENAGLYRQAQELAALEERQKLARELHDSVSQALYGIALSARTARTLLDRDPSKAVEPLEFCLHLAETSLTEMRALIFELRLESLEAEGLVAVICKQANAIQVRYGIQVETNLCVEPSVQPSIKDALYRITQEALQNVVKHSSAAHVAVSLDCTKSLLALDICDDGQGFNTSGSFPGHLGLKSMRERAELVGGRFSVVSAPNSGCCIHVRVPISQPEKPSSDSGRIV